MCQMDIDDNNNQNEQTTLIILPIYAIDVHGICHFLEKENFYPLPIHTERKIDENDISESIVVLLNQIENLPINEDLIESSSNSNLTEYLSTQPFSVLSLNENTLSSSINNNISKRQKKKKLRYPSRRFTVLKKQLKAYLKKKKKKQQQQQQQQHRCDNSSSVIIHHQLQQFESTPLEHSTMIDFQLSPDLSKRKYIYKDITSSNNNPNWRIFQCTQQPSSMSCVDQSITSDRAYNPFYFTNDFISLPDIRIGLSRHRSIKQLHKTISE